MRTTIRRGTPCAARESVLHIAISLADDAALYNDPNRINTERQAPGGHGCRHSESRAGVSEGREPGSSHEPCQPTAAPRPAAKQN